MIVFGHRKCSGGTGYISGHRKGFRASPRQLHGPNGTRRGQTSPLGACLSPSWPIKAHVVAGGMRGTPSGDPICTGTPKTLLVSEYYHPIYESLPLDHFETPHHVRDLIQDSEQHSVTKSHNSYNTKSSSNVKRADPTGSRTM